MKRQIHILPVVLCIAFLLFNSSCTKEQITVTSSKANGIYEIGETATWTLNFPKNFNVDSIRYTIKKGGLTLLEKGILKLKDNQATISYRLSEPGAVLLHFRWKDENNQQIRLTAGAIASTEKITLSSSKPDDFDSFWESQIKGLKKIPKNTKLTKGKSKAWGVDYFKIGMNNINGTKIRGQLAKPSKENNLPALLIVQWAGVYGLQKDWVSDKAKEGWLVLNINPHDLPIDEEEAFYEKLLNGKLKNYPAICNDNKYNSYFLRMYLSCYRAAQYLTERTDWNGETLVVMGASQGGLQSLVTAGLHPKISGSLALVPAGFDMLGPKVGRQGGWPQWYKNIENKDSVKVRAASRYFDVANFVPKIECPVLVGIGLLDETCPPEGIYAGLNQLTSQKEIILLNSEHQNKNDSQKPYYDRAEDVWLPALLEGKNPLTP